jgi:hypothetical protein
MLPAKPIVLAVLLSLLPVVAMAATGDARRYRVCLATPMPIPPSR